MGFATYKMSPRNISLEKSDLKKLIDYTLQKTRETHDAHKRDLKLDGQTEEQKKSINTTLDEAYKIAVFVYGVEGEELLVHDSTIIDQPEFPDQLTRLTIDSFIPFQNRTNGLNPRNGVRINLDFSSAKVLDWQSNVSGPTPNLSEVTIQGVDDDWRTAMHSFLQKLFRARANYRGFLHAAFTYDIYLWLVFMPIYFYGMVVLGNLIDHFLVTISTALKVAIYVYSFFVFANLYRALLGYIRWTFQSIELKGVRSTQYKHRRFWGFLATAIILPIIIGLLTGR